MRSAQADALGPVPAGYKCELIIYGESEACIPGETVKAVGKSNACVNPSAIASRALSYQWKCEKDTSPKVENTHRSIDTRQEADIASPATRNSIDTITESPQPGALAIREDSPFPAADITFFNQENCDGFFGFDTQKFSTVPANQCFIRLRLLNLVYSPPSAIAEPVAAVPSGYKCELVVYGTTKKCITDDIPSITPVGQRNTCLPLDGIASQAMAYKWRCKAA